MRRLVAVLVLALAVALTDRPAAQAEALVFRAACNAGERVLIAAAGDLLFHEPLQRRALATGGTYRAFWQPLAHVFAGADLAYANLEGPAAHGVAVGGHNTKDPGRHLDGRVYGRTTGALIFNYHPSVISDLAASGFDVISTANNHAADRGPLGIERTIDNFEAAGLAFTGTRRRHERHRPWSALTRAKGMTVAWLACSYSTNGMPDPHRQVLDCYEAQEEVLAEIRRLVATPGIDAVIVTPHWGAEGSHRPLESDREWARVAINAGAAAIIGTHPHVLQPWERFAAGDGREALIIYSTGNFVSNQQSSAQRTGIIALVELVRGPLGKAEVSAAGFIPTWVEVEAGHRVRELEGDAHAKASPLAGALRILPRENLVRAARFRELPRYCDQEAPLVAVSRQPRIAARDVSGAKASDAAAARVVAAFVPWTHAVAATTPDGQQDEALLVASLALPGPDIAAVGSAREQEVTLPEDGWNDRHEVVTTLAVAVIMGVQVSAARATPLRAPWLSMAHAPAKALLTEAQGSLPAGPAPDAPKPPERRVAMIVTRLDGVMARRVRLH